MVGKLLSIILASFLMFVVGAIVYRWMNSESMETIGAGDASSIPGRALAGRSVPVGPTAIQPSPAASSRPALPIQAMATPVRLSYSYPEDYALGGWGGAVGIGDVTGDGVLDLAVVVVGAQTGDSCRVAIYTRAVGTSGLSRRAEHPLDDGCNTNSGGMVVGDINGDGVADIVVGTLNGIAILASDGNGGLVLRRAVVGRQIMQVGLIDVDLDGRQDVVGLGWGSITGGYDPTATTIFYGDGSGGVSRWDTLATPQRGYNDLKIADVTGDGLPDLVIASGQAFYFWVIPLAPDGGFLAPVAYPSPDAILVPNAVAVADLNLDGRKDVVVNTPANRPRAALWVYLQGQDGRLGTPIRLSTHDLPGPMLGADLNSDWMDDIAVFHTGWDFLGTYLQLPEGGMSVERLDDALTPDLMNRQSIAAGDLDGDGCMDVATIYVRHLMLMWSENCVPRRAYTGGNLPATRGRR